MKQTIAKILAVLALLSMLALAPGCALMDAAGLGDGLSPESSSTESEVVYNAISDYYGRWNITGVHQIPYVSDCSPEEALEAEGGSVQLDAELFEAAVTAIQPEYILAHYSPEELEAIGVRDCGQDAALQQGAYVISICDFNANYEQYYLVVLDSDSLLYVNPNGYVFSLRKAV